MACSTDSMTKSAHEKPPMALRMSRLWRPSDAPIDPTALALYRTYLLSLPLLFLAMPAIVVGLASNFIFHRTLVSGRVICALCALALLPSIFRGALRVWLAFTKRSWTRRGVPVRRSDEPARYWFWTGMEFVPVVVMAMAAGYLLWQSASMG